MRSMPIVCATALVAAACAASSSARAVDARAEEQAIRALDDQWNAAIAKKDVEANVDMYAPDGAILWPNAPIGKGTAAIRAGWTEMLKAPNLKLVLVPEEVKVAQAGDIATDVGTAGVEMDTPQGHFRQNVKYVVVWKKANGAWKVLYDTFNSSDAPPPPPAAAPAKK